MALRGARRWAGGGVGDGFVLNLLRLLGEVDGLLGVIAEAPIRLLLHLLRRRRGRTPEVVGDLLLLLLLLVVLLLLLLLLLLRALRWRCGRELELVLQGSELRGGLVS